MIVIHAELGHGRLRLHVEGHEERKAGGLVCAAVSAVTQTALLGLAAIADQHPHLVQLHISEQEQPC